MSQSDTIEFWTVEEFFQPQRKIYLGSITSDVEGSESSVDAAMAKKFEKAMTILEYFGPKSPITIIMNNPGGDLYHSLAIYDRIMDSPCHVTIHATGYVMSGGSLILQAGDKRLLTRTASVLLHYGTPSSNDDHHVNADRWAEENKRVRGMMEEIPKRPGRQGAR
jgi:ATP-dependent protease ClpP protease subunit